VKITPAHRLYGLGAVLLVALTICSQHFSRRGDAVFIISLSAAGVTYLLAFREFLNDCSLSRRVVIYGLVLAGIWHVLFLRMPPGEDDDIHRYVWDGRMQRLGLNPYLVVPSDPAVAGLHTSQTRGLNNSYLPSLYPPGAELFFRAVTAIHESTLALKIAFVACDAAIIFVVFNLLRDIGLAEHWVLAYAWHPLLAVEVAGSGHIDIVGVLLLVLSAAALVRTRRTVAALLFGLAVMVKLLPIVLLPIYWKRVRTRDLALAFLVAALLYIPFLDHGRIPFGSLGTFVRSFRFNDPVFAAVERVTSPQIAAGLAALVGLLTALWMSNKSLASSGDAFAWPMTTSLLFAPVIYPWYLLWMLPFVRSVATLPIVVWTISMIPTYYVWHLRAAGRPWIVPQWVTLVEYGSLVLSAAIILVRPGTRNARARVADNQF
jgi:alpha-1,6-mannosyltransferase